MTRRAVSEAALLWALRLVPVMLLLLYGQSGPEDPRPVRADDERAYAWLSLPAGAPRKQAWVGEWEMLKVVETEDNSGIVPAPVVQVESPEVSSARHERGPFRIRLAGQVRDGTRVLYCFFDTHDQRWFRMAGGGVDAEAAIRLEADSCDGRPLVTDLLDGSRYILLAEETQLERIRLEAGPEHEELE